MNIIYKIIAAFAVSASFLFSQPLGNYSTGFRTIFDKSEKVNPYYFSGNPAYLGYEISEELLSLRSRYSGESGGFRRFVDPGNIRDYMLSASGKKVLDSSQVFRGSFSFRRKENNDWQWIFSRDYSGNTPFLIGDSTTGNTRWNGIIMNAEYAHMLFEILGVGVSVNYSVDQGLKQVSPRPTSKNREFNITGGLSYRLGEFSSAGFKAAVYDDVETINYREDVGALTTETIIMKFRGYDYPNVFRKKTETRYSYNNGYSGGVDFFYGNPSMYSLDISAGAGFNKINVKDDAVNPFSDGFWKTSYYKGGILFHLPVGDEARAGFNYIIRYYEDWSENLNYLVLYSRNKKLVNSIAAGLEYRLSQKISAGAEGGLELTGDDRDDYYSGLKSRTKSYSYSLILGMKAVWSDDFGTFLSAGFGSEKIKDNKLESAGAGIYFTGYRYRDLHYYQVPGTSYDFNFTASYLPSFGGELLLDIYYSVKIAGSSQYFADTKRTGTDVSVEYRVRAF